jgi:hypothetical protein
MGEAFKSVTGTAPTDMGTLNAMLNNKWQAPAAAPAPAPVMASGAPSAVAPAPNQRTMGYAPTSAPGTTGGAKVLPRNGLMRTLGGAAV